MVCWLERRFYLPLYLNHLYDVGIKGQAQINFNSAFQLIMQTLLSFIEGGCSYLAIWLRMVCRRPWRFYIADVTLESKINNLKVCLTTHNVNSFFFDRRCSYLDSSANGVYIECFKSMLWQLESKSDICQICLYAISCTFLWRMFIFSTIVLDCWYDLCMECQGQTYLKTAPILLVTFIDIDGTYVGHWIALVCWWKELV